MMVYYQNWLFDLIRWRIQFINHNYIQQCHQHLQRTWIQNCPRMSQWIGIGRVRRTRGKSANGESCFQRRKRLSWRDASGNRDTYPLLRENISLSSYIWLQRKWRFGSRTIGIKWREPGLRKERTRICSLLHGAFLSQSWWGTDERVMFSVLRTSLQRHPILLLISSSSPRFITVITSAWHIWHLSVIWVTCSPGPGEHSFYAAELSTYKVVFVTCCIINYISTMWKYIFKWVLMF